MARRRKQQPSNSDQQLEFDFDSVVKRAQVLSRNEVASGSDQEVGQRDYDPVAQTAAYMQRAVQFERHWGTTIQQARQSLLQIDARQLYLDFLTDLKRQIEQNSPKAPRLATLLEQVAIRGLGMTRDEVRVESPLQGGTRWRVHLDTGAVQAHLNSHIVGQHFLNPVRASDTILRPHGPIIAASDVSQHRSAVPVPARFFKRSVPFVLNNAAGTVFGRQEGRPRYDNVFNPRPDEALLRWMLIDPSYQDDLEPEDYQRCLASAMDVGQYKFDLEYLLKADKRAPDIVFRDGSLFPQDAYLDNFIVENKRGEFTREAIRDMLACLSYAKEIGVLYCGVSKNVQLKVYSAIVDWYIARSIDVDWEVGSYTLNDGQAMSLLLSSPDFVGDNLSEVIGTCLIRRSFTTRANLNTRANLHDLDSYFRFYQDRHQDVDVTPFRRLCEIAHVFMFFLGHSRSPQQQLPRYESYYHDLLGPPTDLADRALSALRHCGFTSDEDHSYMAEKPVTYLIPAVTQQAHTLSKDVGKYIDATTGQWIMAQYRQLLSNSPRIA